MIRIRSLYKTKNLLWSGVGMLLRSETANAICKVSKVNERRREAAFVSCIK